MPQQPRHAKQVMQAVLGVATLGLALVIGSDISAQVGVPTPPAQWRAPAAMGTGAPVPIAKLVPGPAQQIVAGRVAEVFGANFILADASGRALVQPGRGAPPAPVPGAAVTVEGRFVDGVLHAAFLRDAAGTVTALRPAGPPRFGRGMRGGAGPDGERGPPPCGPVGSPPPN